MKNAICKICGSTISHTFITVKERMLNTLDEFLYFQCNECNCLQIKTIPDNLSQYYPSDYYSYKSLDKLIKSPIRKWVDTHRINHLVYNSSYVGKFLNVFLKPLEYPSWVASSNIKKDAKILDVGCGQGRLLLRMALGGFTNLTGLDPFINENITYKNGVNIIKIDLEKFSSHNQTYDLIMLHHSLEHMPDQLATMTSISKLLSPKGVALIRIPLVDSYAWEFYKDRWVQLDAPRHLYLHSKKSIALLAEKSDLSIEQTIYDSSKFQFTGSELYKRDIPLNSDKKTRDIFSKEQIQKYSKKAKELNDTKKGDQAVFFIKKST